jgi:PKD repeat protein
MKFSVLFTRFACLFLFVLLSFSSKASHVLGSFIGYEPIDSVTYKVTVIFYRDCNGITLSTVNLGVTGKKTGKYYKALPFVSATDITASFMGCSIQSRCSGSFTYGVQQLIFSDTINIAGGACTYRFSFEECCRSAAITTGASGANGYNYAEINKCAGMNTSPMPMLAPQFLFPLKANISIAPTLMELIDKTDSVVFDIVAPLNDSVTIIPYLTGYSATKPFSGTGIIIDPITGQIRFTPNKKNEVSSYVIEAREYRNIGGKEVLAGITRQDLAGFIVDFSPTNKTPNVNITGLTQDACVGKSVCITYGTSDVDSGDSTFLSFVNTIPGALYASARAGGYDSGTVCITPTKNNVRRAPYLLTITARDNACPMNGLSSTCIPIYFRPAYDTSNHAVISKSVTCNKVNIKASKDTFSDLTLDWLAVDGLVDTVIGDSAILYFAKKGWNHFAIRSKNKVGCFGPYEWDSVYVNPSFTMQISKSADTAGCAADTFHLSALALNGTAPYKYSWADAPAIHSAQAAVKIKQTHYTKVFIADDNGCFASDSIRVAVSTPSANIGPDTTLCGYIPLTLSATSPVGIAPFKYEWLGIDTTPIISVFITNDTSRFQLKMTDSTGCSTIKTKTVIPYKFSVFGGLDKQACYGDSVTIVLTALDGLAPYTFPWPATKPNRAPLTYAAYNDSVFTVSITDDRGCVAYDTIAVKTNPFFTITSPAAYEGCLGTDIALPATATGGTPPYKYGWNGGSSNASNILQLTVSSNSTLLKLTVTDSANCAAQQNITVAGLVNPKANAGADSSVCIGFATKLVGSATLGAAPYSLKWSTGDTVDTITVKPTVKSTYKLTVVDAKGCKGEDNVMVTVLTRETVNITAPFQICANYPQVPLSASKTGGVWSGAGISGEFFKPATAGVGKHKLIYNNIGTNLCPTQDTTEVEVLGNITTADFTAATTSGQVATAIQFTDKSLGSPTTWQWTVTDSLNAVVLVSAQQNPLFTFANKGVYGVRLIVDNGTCYDTIEQSNYLTISSLGLQNIGNNRYNIYPNPAGKEVFIEGGHIAALVLTDVQGKEIEVEYFEEFENKYRVQLPKLCEGIYFLKVIDSNANTANFKLRINN